MIKIINKINKINIINIKIIIGVEALLRTLVVKNVLSHELLWLICLNQ